MWKKNKKPTYLIDLEFLRKYNIVALNELNKINVARDVLDFYYVVLMSFLKILNYKILIVL